MSSNTKKSQDQEENKQSPQSKVSSILLSAMAFCFYVLLGVFLCYLKIIFGDYCRDETMSYDKFVDTDTNLNGDFKRTTEGHHTTPSVNYYNNVDKANYCKQLFVDDPNFIKTSTKTYSKSGKDQLLKTLFLETNYSIFGAINVLQNVPDWVIILFGPLIYFFMHTFSLIFLWIILSYRIFKYCIEWFSSGLIGGIVGFIAWIWLMCFGGYFVVNIAYLYGFFRLLYVIFNPTDPLVKLRYVDINEPDKPYMFFKYIKDMNSTNAVIHFLFIYVVYLLLGNFSKQFSYVFLVTVLVVYFFFFNKIHFISTDYLTQDGWTTKIDPINLSKPLSMFGKVMNIAGNALQTAKGIASGAVGTVVGTAVGNVIGKKIGTLAGDIDATSLASSVSRLTPKVQTQQPQTGNGI
jgi:hypothetical protein